MVVCSIIKEQLFIIKVFIVIIKLTTIACFINVIIINI